MNTFRLSKYIEAVSDKNEPCKESVSLEKEKNFFLVSAGSKTVSDTDFIIILPVAWDLVSYAHDLLNHCFISQLRRESLVWVCGVRIF